MWVRNNRGNVFVGNLPPDFPDERLAETFDPYGIVLSAIVARDPATGARLRYGFVDIASERAATQAISALDGIQVDGCKLNVKATERRAGAKKPAGAAPPRQPTRTPPPRRTPLGVAEPPPHRLTAAVVEPAPRPAQSDLARSVAAEIEPPPRRDFDIAYKPARRKTPSFQVERRSLPRRVQPN
jgi:RNA recognition motif-containing protein